MQTVELSDDLDRGVVELRQSLGNRLDFPPTKILERYLRNELSVGFKFTCDFGGRSAGMIALVTFDNRPHGSGHHQAPSGVMKDKFSVFVENIHVVNDREGGVNVVGGIIRLKSLYKIADGGICDSLYFSLVSGKLLFTDRLVVENGELDRGRLSRLRAGKLPYEMIEAGSQVVDNLASEHTEAEWDRKLLMILNSLKVELVLWIGEDGVLAGLKKPGDFGIEITDVLLGPY